MGAFLQEPTARLILWLALFAMLVTVGVFILARIRRMFQEAEQPVTSDLMSNFRELYSQGELSDEEYQSIKNKLANRMQRELKDAGEKG
jgi:uncharacterized membrane protein